MASAASAQVRSDPAFARRVAMPWQHLVVLERIARGGGDTRWYFARAEAEIDDVLDGLRPGSAVSFYFDDQLHVEMNSEAAQLRMFDAVTPRREIVIGYPSVDTTTLDVELPTGASELTEILMWHPGGELVVWGHFPERTGVSTVTVVLADADGVVRAHPH